MKEKTAGGRIFPGVHHRAAFRVQKAGNRFEISLNSYDGRTSVSLAADIAKVWARGSIFASLEEASAFFEAGSLGYSPVAAGGRFEGLELRCQKWRLEPLSMERVRSSLFDNEAVFPRGSIEFDCALLMRGIEHEWYQRQDICCTGSTYAAAGSSVQTSAARNSKVG